MAAEQTHPIEAYFWPTPNGLRVSVALAEFGIPHVVNFINIQKREQFSPEFLQLSPTGKIPAIVDPEGPDGNPISVFESGAILMYLGRKFGRFYPVDDERKRVAVEEWLVWQVSNFGPTLSQIHHFSRFAKEDVPYAKDMYQKQTNRLYKVLDNWLADREYLAGEFSIADMAGIGWTSRHEWQNIDLAEHPNLKAWYDRMMARPGVAKGMAIKPPPSD